MSWTTLQNFTVGLTDALSSYDWAQAAQLCEKLVQQTEEEPTPCPAPDAEAILRAIVKKRRFELAAPVAEAFISSGQSSPGIRRRYGQVLIEQGLYVAAEAMLLPLAAESFKATPEVAEAHGLLGRIYKQRYIGHSSGNSFSKRALLERCLAEYLQVYRLSPNRYLWHGINAVALLRRAQFEGVSMVHYPDAETIAREILQADAIRYASTSSDAFDLATRLEVMVALADVTAAEQTALEYSRHPDADAFEIGSTLRQLTEIWQLRDDTAPGHTVLPVLRAAKLRREGGQTRLVGKDAINRELQAVTDAQSKLLEKNFGDFKTQTLKWYKLGLERAQSVARIERPDGRGFGTGWLVRRGDCFAGGNADDLLVVTNAHVVNATGADAALTPDQASANFQALGAVVRFKQIVSSSPSTALDFTFLEIDGAPPAGAKALPIAKRKVRLTIPEPLIYIMGHPEGRDLEFSLQDNKLLGCNDRLLHYRTPTEGGHSGSPVFEENAWEVVALHHAGGLLERLDGTQPPYQGNEGITLGAILQNTKP